MRGKSQYDLDLMTVPASDAPAAEWLVYADALQQQGDPRGELIALVNAEDAAKRDAHVQQHAKELLGPAAEFLANGVLKVTWRWSFVDSAEVRGSNATTIATALDALLAAPTATRLRALQLIGVPDAGAPVLDLNEVVGRLGRHDVPASLAELSLIDERAAKSTSLTSREFEPDQNLVTFGALTPLWAMKNLRALKLVVADTRQLEPGTINARELTSLTIHGLRFSGATYGDPAEASALSVALAEAKLPKLEVFDVRLCEEWVAGYLDDTGAYTSHNVEGDFDDGNNEGSDWEGEFGAALRNLVTFPLKRLALTSFATTGSLLGLLGSIGLPATLKELDLSDSALSSVDLEWFQLTPIISRLERLVLNSTNFTAADVEVLASRVPKVEHSPANHQRELFGDDDDQEARAPLPKYRYVVGME